MSSASEIRWTRPRSNANSLPMVSKEMLLKWSKLIAEATEIDTKEEIDLESLEDVDEDCECEDCGNESDKTERPGDTTDAPLNLCHKSSTMPNMGEHFEASDNSIDFSTGKKPAEQYKSYESTKKASCTLPHFQSNNYQDFLLKKNACDSDKSVGKNSLDRKEYIENIGTNKLSTGINSSLQNYNNRTPMKEVNNFKIMPMSENKKSTLKNASSHNGLERPLKSVIANKPFESGVDGGQKVQGNKHTGIQCESKKNSSVSEEDGDAQKQKSVQNVQNNDHVRFAVPAEPSKLRNTGKTIVVNGKPYQILAPLGKGGSSCVYLVLNSNNQLLAVKCMKLSGVNESVKNDYLNEIQHLLRMQHSNHVIRLYDHQYITTQKLLYVVMEKGDTDLSRFLKDKAASEEGITPELIMYYWNEMLLAVKSIHDNNIIHRDLKPANFLLVSGRLKLIDFGIASSIQNEQTSILMDTQSGTFNYMSPEALVDLGSGNEVVLKIGRKSDVWSLGCILYYFLYKKTPYQDVVKPLQKMKAITDPNYVVQFPKLSGMPDILIESCKRCLVHDRKKRASIEELLELKNRPLLTLSQVLTKLKGTLTEAEYAKAEKALSDEFLHDN